MKNGVLMALARHVECGVPVSGCPYKCRLPRSTTLNKQLCVTSGSRRIVCYVGLLRIVVLELF